MIAKLAPFPRVEEPRRLAVRLHDIDPPFNRYQLTTFGRRVTALFTKTYGRVLAPGLVQLDPALPPAIATRSPLAVAWRHLDHALDDYIGCQLTAA